MRLMMLEGRGAARETWITALQSNGFDLDRFPFLADAEEALRHIDAHYAMLLIDRELPDGDGVDWLRARRRAGLQMPLVVVTPAYDLENRIRALEAARTTPLPTASTPGSWWRGCGRCCAVNHCSSPTF